MTAAFIFNVDEVASLVRVTMGGFFSPSDIADFRKARDEAHMRLRCGPNQHVTLIDIRSMKIQSQEAVAEFQKLFAERRQRSRRIAIVVSSSLSRTQVKRAAAGRDAGYFQDPAEAEAWLLDRLEQAA
jgi:hypothetical protein